MAENRCKLHINDKIEEPNHFYFIPNMQRNTTMQNTDTHHHSESSNSYVDGAHVVNMPKNNNEHGPENEKSGTEMLNGHLLNSQISTHHVWDATNAPFLNNSELLGLLDCFEEPPPLAAPPDPSDEHTSTNKALPPLQQVTWQENAANPSPLTLPSTATQKKSGNSESNERNDRMMSVGRVNFDINEAGVALSVPVSTEIPNGNDNYLTYHDGYDSNGECGPFFDAVEGEKIWDSDSNDEEPPSPEAAVEEAPANPKAPVLTEEEIKRMNVNQLKEALKVRKQSTNGKQDVLQG